VCGLLLLPLLPLLLLATVAVRGSNSRRRDRGRGRGESGLLWVGWIRDEGASEGRHTLCGCMKGSLRPSEGGGWVDSGWTLPYYRWHNNPI
jgi:hypothetical protein